MRHWRRLPLAPIHVAALVVCFLAAPDLLSRDRYLPPAFDLAGTWVVPGSWEYDVICSGSRNQGCLTNRLAVAGRDYMVLENVGSESGMFPSPFRFQGTPASALRISYRGTYHHHVGSARLVAGRQAGASTSRPCSLVEIVYDLEGTLFLDQWAAAFAVDLRGVAPAEDNPEWAAGLELRLSTYSGDLLGGQIQPFTSPDGSRIALGVGFSGSPTRPQPPTGCVWLNDLGPQLYPGGTVVYSYLGYERGEDPTTTLGTIVGQVSARLAGGVYPGRGSIEVLQQAAPLQEKIPAESEEQYEDYVRRLSRTVLQVEITEGGSYEAGRLALFTESLVGTQPALYTLKVLHAEADVDLAIFGQPIIYFKPRLITNVRVPSVQDIALDSIAEPGIKRSLAEQLSRLSKNSYASAESSVLAHLDGLAAGGTALTPAELEGLRRAIWAERIVLEGSSLARSLLGDTLDAVGGIVAEILDDLPLQSRVLRQEQKKLERLKEINEEGLGDIALTKFRVQHGVTREQMRDAHSRFNKLQDRAEYSILAEHAKRLVKIISNLVRDSALALGYENERVELIAQRVDFTLKTLISIVEYQSIQGALSQLIQQAIQKAMEDLTALRFDGEVQGILAAIDVLPLVDLSSVSTFCKEMRPLLVYSHERMLAWTAADRAAYEADSAAAAGILNRLIEQGTAAKRAVIYANAVSRSAAQAQEIYGLVGVVIPFAKYASYASQAAKFGSLLAAAGFAYSFYSGPCEDLMTEGVYRAFGESPPRGQGGGAAAASDPGIAAGATVGTEGGGGAAPNAKLLGALTAATDNLDRVAMQVAALVQSNDIGQASVRAAATDSGDLASALYDWRRARRLVLAEVLEAPAASTLFGKSAVDPAIAADADAEESVRAAVDALRALLLRTFTGEFLDTGKSEYDALRAQAAARFNAIRDPIYILLNSVRSAGSLLVNQPGGYAPLVAAVFESIESEETGAAAISRAGESFRVEARVLNRSTERIEGLSVQLLAPAPAGEIAIEPPGAATLPEALEPDDGVEGSGPDEAAVSWRIAINGSVPRPRLLQLALLQGGSLARGIAPLEDSRILELDPAELDGDLDGLASSYEEAEGLDPGRDDAREDLDGDGLANEDEAKRGTRPLEPDSDGDGLPDGEEARGGADGRVTDPLAADSDEDGLPDGVDPDPIAPEGAESPPRDEPILAVSAAEAMLTAVSPEVFIDVSNAGGGSLRWTAVSANPAIVETGPRPFESRPPGLLVIRAADGFDLKSRLSTTVTVIDLSGVDPDTLTISVVAGEEVRPPDPPDPPDPPGPVEIAGSFQILKGSAKRKKDGWQVSIQQSIASGPAVIASAAELRLFIGGVELFAPATRAQTKVGKTKVQITDTAGRKLTLKLLSSAPAGRGLHSLILGPATAIQVNAGGLPIELSSGVLPVRLVAGDYEAALSVPLVLKGKKLDKAALMPASADVVATP